MEKFNPIDIRKYLNHKLIYSKLPQGEFGEEIGLDNTYILSSNIKFSSKEILDNVCFCFSFGRFDNIVCNGQTITLNEIATKIHFIGFAYWGDTNEFFKVVYEDLSVEMIKVPFIDWSHLPNNDKESINWYGENISRVKSVITSGEDVTLINIHHMYCEINKNKKIKEIIFPENMFTHIFAMTLENENCHIKKQNREDKNNGNYQIK